VALRLDASTDDDHDWAVELSLPDVNDHGVVGFPLPTAQDTPTIFRSRAADHVPQESQNLWLAPSFSSGLSSRHDVYNPPDNSADHNSPRGRYSPHQSPGPQYPLR